MTADDRPTLEMLSDQLRAPDRAVRLRAAAALGDLPGAWDRLTFALRDREPEVRRAAVAGLEKQLAADPSNLDRLYAHLAPECRDGLRLELVTLAIRLGTPRALKAVFLAAIDGAHGSDRAEIVAQLAASPALDTRFVTSQSADEDAKRATLAAEILAQRGVAPRAVVQWRLLHDPYVLLGPAGIRTLCRAIPERDDASIDEVSATLAANRKRTQATVLELLDDPSLPAARAAAATLGQWDEPWSIEALVRVASDGTRPGRLRGAALGALARLEAPEAGETLAAAMLDEQLDPGTRRTCAEALGAIGNAAALPPLRALVEGGSGDRRLLRSAREAIRRIEEGDAARIV